MNANRMLVLPLNVRIYATNEMLVLLCTGGGGTLNAIAVVNFLETCVSESNFKGILCTIFISIFMWVKFDLQ